MKSGERLQVQGGKGTGRSNPEGRRDDGAQHPQAGAHTRGCPIGPSRGQSQMAGALGPPEDHGVEPDHPGQTVLSGAVRELPLVSAPRAPGVPGSVPAHPSRELPRSPSASSQCVFTLLFPACQKQRGGGSKEKR